MTSIMVLVIAFGLGCVTGVVVHLLSHDRRSNDAPGKSRYWPLPVDE
jgi:hypothetical protein